MRNIIYALIFLTIISCDTSKKEINKTVKSESKAGKLPYFNSAIFTPEWDKAEHKIPEFSFLNQNGKEITNNTYKGKIYIADFFFTTCPGICPKLTSNMSVLQETYKKDNDVLLLSHTVMPWVDTVNKLKAYGVDNGVNSKKWNLVTGKKEALYALARSGYFADEDFKKTQDESDFIHTENFLLIDKNGHIRGVYNGTIALDVKRLIRHIALLKKES